MPSNEVALQDQVDNFTKAMLLPRRGTFDRLLPSTIDADTFVGLAAAELYRNPKTAQVAMNQPESLFIALKECAGLGLQPGTGEYYLTVRRPEKGAAEQILGIVGYMGHIKRMYMFGTVLAVHADVVCEGETFIRNDPLPPRHIFVRPRNKDVSNLIGAYAYAMLDGPHGPVCSRVVDMDRPEIMRHREMAGTPKIWDGPFGHTSWTKTVVHELEKWVPKSGEFLRREAQGSVRIAQAQREDIPRAEPVRVEAHVVEGESQPADHVQVRHVQVQQGGADDAGGVPEQDWPTTAKPGGQ